MVFDDIDEEVVVPKVTVWKEIFNQNPENCGDKMKVSQELIVVGCSKNGGTNIIKRNDKTILVTKKSKVSLLYYTITIIEHNTNLPKIKKQKLDNNDSKWMKKYLGTTQTYVFISISSHETLAW